MKKEMFGTEITLLRDTFRRLLRRHAKTNIIKLIEELYQCVATQYVQSESLLPIDIYKQKLFYNFKRCRYCHYASC